MGNKTSLLGADVQVKLDLRRISNFATYDEDKNAFIVLGHKVRVRDLGLRKVIVEVTYDDPTGRRQYYSNYFYLEITGDEE